MDIDEYFAQTQYNGAREITKESNLKSFFLQKCDRVNNYLDKHDIFSKTPSQLRSSVRSYGSRLKVQQNLLKQLQSPSKVTKTPKPKKQQADLTQVKVNLS